MKKVLRVPSPALVIALIALFVALSGTTYAAARTAKASTTRLAWHNLALRNGWTWAGLGTAHPQWAIDSFGVVHLRGSVAHGTTGFTAFVLPAAARPPAVSWFQIVGAFGSDGQLTVGPSGDGALVGSSVDTFASLDGVTFSH